MPWQRGRLQRTIDILEDDIADRLECGAGLGRFGRTLLTGQLLLLCLLGELVGAKIPFKPGSHRLQGRVKPEPRTHDGIQVETERLERPARRTRDADDRRALDDGGETVMARTMTYLVIDHLPDFVEHFD